MKKYLLILCFVPVLSFAEHTFERIIQEIQIIDEVVRLKVGTTYGTCGEREGWWGWSVNSPNHNAWLSLALSAQAQNKKIMVYDRHSSCGGLPTVIQLEGLYLKSNS